MAELGKIERPAADSFEGKRKLYCVPNVYPFKDNPADYEELVNKYWDEVDRQTERLEAAGKIRKVFCENIAVSGEQAYDALSRLNAPALQLIKKKVDEGAELVPLEKDEIFGPFLDWANCLNVVMTREVFVKIFGFYTELSKSRLEHAAGLIDSSLPSGEAGLLIMRDEDRIQLRLGTDIEIFLVTPPSYDDILRWLRDKMKDSGRPLS